MKQTLKTIKKEARDDYDDKFGNGGDLFEYTDDKERRKDLVFYQIQELWLQYIERAYFLGMEIGYKGAIEDVKTQGIENIE